jgi:hypothetical protein
VVAPGFIPALPTPKKLRGRCGTIFRLAVLVGSTATGHPWFALLWPVIGYRFAWFGHFVIEGNKPATFSHPWWSFRQRLPHGVDDPDWADREVNDKGERGQ